MCSISEIITGRPKKNGDKIWTHVFGYSSGSISFEDKLNIALERLVHYGHFEYNRIFELIQRARIIIRQDKAYLLHYIFTFNNNYIYKKIFI